MNFAQVIEHHTARYPDSPVATCQGHTTTYAEMSAAVQALATGLQTRLGIGRGDVVGILSGNSTEFLEVMLATNHIGAITMPINWRLAPEEIGYLLGNSRAVAMVADAEFANIAVQAGAGSPPVAGLGMAGVDLPGWTNLADLRLIGSGTVPVAALDSDDLIRLMYTSGTTSHPKGVMISQANLIWKCIAHCIEFSITAEDVGLVCGPLYHVGALDLTATNMLYAGGSVIIQGRFDAAAAVQEMSRGVATNVWLAPAMMNAILNLPGVEKYDLSSIRYIIGGGEKMPAPLFRRIRQVFPSAWFADAYGLTETVGGDTFLDRRGCLTKAGSVGKPCLHLEVQVLDDTGQVAAAGEQGEVVLRGPKVFKGYWRNKEATTAAFSDGWFRTGDTGYLDLEGYLYIVDRKKDVIVSGGENVASPEVERVLYEHPAVLEVAVVGRPDARWGEVPVAFVVLREGKTAAPEELIGYCSQRLAKFKSPKRVIFLDTLPRNPSGKVLKRALREQVGAS